VDTLWSQLLELTHKVNGYIYIRHVWGLALLFIVVSGQLVVLVVLVAGCDTEHDT
jgi:hypothetical protein